MDAKLKIDISLKETINVHINHHITSLFDFVPTLPNDLCENKITVIIYGTRFEETFALPES